MQLTYFSAKRTFFIVSACLVFIGCGQDHDRLAATGGGEHGGTSGDASTTNSGGSSVRTSSASSIGTPISIMMAPSQLTFRLGHSQTVEFHVSLIVRGNAGGVTVETRGLPVGVSSTTAKVTEARGTAELSIDVGPTAQVGGPFEFDIVARSGSGHTSIAKATLYVAQSSGSLDTTLGGSGVLSIPAVLPSQDDTDVPREFPRAASIDQFHRIVVGGFSSQITDRGWLLRLTPEGSFDTSFGATGILSDFGEPASRVLGLSTDHYDLFVGGEFTDVNGTKTGLLRRLTQSGLREPSFNDGRDVMFSAGPTGIATFLGGVAVTAAGMPYAYTSDGQSLATFSWDATRPIESIESDWIDGVFYGRKANDTSFEIGHFLRNWTIDTEFGSSGVARIDCPVSKPFAVSVKLLPRSSRQNLLALVHCAGDSAAGDSQAELWALSPSGTEVATFGQSGRLLVAPSGRSAVGMTDSTGGAVILERQVLTTSSDGEFRTQVTRVDAAGKIDDSFGSAGVLGLPDIEDAVMAYDATAARIVVVGRAPDSAGGGLKIVRFWL